MATNMTSLRPIFYDTETTGIRTDRERIVEIAAYDPVQNRHFEKLINPGIPIPAEASAIHRITDDMVASHPPFDEIGREFIDFCGEGTILIAHNNDAFDMPILKAEFGRHGLQWPEWTFLDSLKWARRYRPDLPRHTLQFLREMYVIAENNAHRALDDVIVLHQVFSCMVDDLSIEDVFALLNQPKEIKSMPFGKHQGKSLKDLPKDYIQWLSKSGALDKDENKQLKISFANLGLC